jgi:hypothetical protein
VCSRAATGGAVHRDALVMGCETPNRIANALVHHKGENR